MEQLPCLYCVSPPDMRRECELCLHVSYFDVNILTQTYKLSMLDDHDQEGELEWVVTLPIIARKPYPNGENALRSRANARSPMMIH